MCSRLSTNAEDNSMFQVLTNASLDTPTPSPITPDTSFEAVLVDPMDHLLADDMDKEMNTSVEVELDNGWEHIWCSSPLSTYLEEQSDCNSNTSPRQTDNTTSPTNNCTSKWQGYKIVGDNWEINCRPRYQTVDSRTTSLHYFYSYAVLDLIDHGHLSDIPPTVPD